MEVVRPNIAFAGLTAAGKTTHAKILAEQLEYKYISATEIILDILDISKDAKSVWLTSYDEIEKAREGDKVDIELESRIKKMADKTEGLILDTWAMAYIYQGPLIRIWIDSDEESRSRKCFVSQGDQKILDLEGCNNLITKKDGDTRKKFKDRLGFDLFTDMSKYDAIICNTDLIPEPTDIASMEGIRSFSPVVLDTATFLINQALGTTSSVKSGDDLRSKYGSMVLDVNEKPWSF